MILFGCIALSVLAVLYVFNVPESVTAGPEKTRISFLQEQKEAVYENLRDLNFEYKAGKVPDQDYYNLKNSLEAEAAGILAEIAKLETPVTNTTGRNRKGLKI